MARLEVKGAAAKLVLSSGITNASMTLQATGVVTGWPTGATYDFEVVLDRNTAKEEHILCTALTPGTPNSLSVTTRGYNGTTAQSHDPNCTVEHFISGTLIDDLGGHAYDTARDDHTQYIPVSGGRGFSGVASIVGSPVSVGTAISGGSGNLLARANHVHDLAAGAIDTSDLFVAGVVDNAALASAAVDGPKIALGSVDSGRLATDAVTTAKILDGAVTTNKIGANQVAMSRMAAFLRPWTTCTSSTRPSAPLEGDGIYETDTDLWATYNGTDWSYMPGQRIASVVVGANSPAAGGHKCGSALTFTMPRVMGQRRVKVTGYIRNLTHGSAPTLHDVCDAHLVRTSDDFDLVSRNIVLHGVFGTEYHEGAIVEAYLTNTEFAVGVTASVSIYISAPTGTLKVHDTSSIVAELV